MLLNAETQKTLPSEASDEENKEEADEQSSD
jgi:hypothetical protein